MTPDDVRELFAVFGPVDVRRMFSGAGIFADQIMIGLIHQNVIYLKTDATSAPAFDREGLGYFTYVRQGREAALSSYRRMPDRLYDDPEELAAWARAALAAAERGQAKRTGRARRPKQRQSRTR